ncbi:hypothetical protein ILUMI_17588, partial [Ignelater luminosus]
NAVTKAIEYRKSQNVSTLEKIKGLESAILNGPKHILGDHSGCAEKQYFCSGSKKNEINMAEAFRKCGLLGDIITAVRRVANCANSLIYDVTNNCAELYNAQGRCHAAVIAHNATGALHEVIRKTTKTQFRKYTTVFCERQKRKLYIRQDNNKKRIRKSKPTAEVDEDYGPNAAEPVSDVQDN